MPSYTAIFGLPKRMMNITQHDNFGSMVELQLYRKKYIVDILILHISLIPVFWNQSLPSPEFKGNNENCITCH